MLTIETVNNILDMLVDELPQEIFTDLNGGISLLSEKKVNPEARNNDLLIMGEYSVRGFSRTILIYYGSFAAAYGNYPENVWVRELRKVLRHEFLHHVESLAGERGLEKWDRQQMERYRSGLTMEEEHLENL
ncbi:MAG: metallopeptidase family protein [Hespellia sp.]|nr:metallopeptidase family protein [Hespellia sp.]